MTPVLESDDGGKTGRVSLVGAGPGDPELLTIKARKRLGRADRVLHDKLVCEDILATIPPDKRENVGRRKGEVKSTQADTNERLVELAEQGLHVVRLKGGDPFVFGRGGEEMEHLAAAGVPFEIVPGVTSALSAPAVAGIPATHRDHACSLTVVTGHEAGSGPSVDWERLADMSGTIVVLMGVSTLPEYTAELIDNGRDPETPVAMIERATWSDQRVVTGTLETIVDRRDAADVSSPAVTVIGSVADCRDDVLAEMVAGYEGVVLQDGGSAVHDPAEGPR